MSQLVTVYSSLNPIDCHIIKGRLEKEGMQSYIYDENIVHVHPFRAVAVGGAKLKVVQEDLKKTKELISLIEEEFLIDEDGVYQLQEVFDQEINRQEKLLKLRAKIRSNPLILESDTIINEIEQLADNGTEFIASERNHIEYRTRKFQFSWKDFWYEVLDFDGNVFKYFRSKPYTYYLEEELLDNYLNSNSELAQYECPICRSNDVIKSNAIDFNWNLSQIISIILGSLLIAPGMFISRRKCHCFNCGNNYKV